MRGLEQARYQARRSFKRRIAEKETLNPAIIAKVGNGAGTVIVSGRPGWIYIRLHGDDNQLTEAKLGIPLDTGSLDDAWVRVKRASPRKASYYVLLEFITSSTGDPAPPISAHALDPDAGPHTGTLPEDEVVFGDAGHDHGGGAQGKKVSHPDLEGVAAGQHHEELTPAQHDARDHSPVADTMDVAELVDGEGRLLTGTQKTDLTDGGMTVLHQHAGGVTASVLITLTNRTGGQRAAGDVVVTDPDNDESFVGTAEVGYQGKVLVVGETIADLTGGLCWERGGPFGAKVIGAVSRNDGLRTSATIYRAEAAPSITGGGVFAVALSPNISGEGTVKAVFLDAIGTGGGNGDGVGTIEIQEDDAKVADADTVNFEGGGGRVTDEGGGKVTVDISAVAEGPADLYFATTGDDGTGDGTVGDPYRTLAKCVSELNERLATTHTIHGAAGTYAEPIDFRKFHCSPTGKVVLEGTATCEFTGTLAHEGDTVGGVVGKDAAVNVDTMRINVVADSGLVVEGWCHFVADIDIRGTLTRGVDVFHNARLDECGNTTTIQNFSDQGIRVRDRSMLVLNGTVTIIGNNSDWPYGIDLVWHSGCRIKQGTTLTITEVSEGFHVAINSYVMGFLPSGTSITIDNTATPGNSYAVYCGDVSSFGVNCEVAIDHFTVGFRAICGAYIGSEGTTTLTNVTTLRQTRYNSYCYLPDIGDSGDRSTIWVYPGGITDDMHPFASNRGDFAARGAGQDIDVFFNFPIPTDFWDLVKAFAVFIAVNTDNSTFDLASDYGRDGEAYNTHSESQTTGAYNFAADEIVEVDISGILGAIAAGDYVGFAIDKNSDTTLLQWIGLKIEYTKA